MPITRTMNMADAVLATIEWLMPEDMDCWLEPYQNCREHGYLLAAKDSDRRVAFSENRNSDDLVVYPGKMGDFEMAGNVPVESAWKHRLYFRYDSVVIVARAIIAHLQGEDKADD